MALFKKKNQPVEPIDDLLNLDTNEEDNEAEAEEDVFDPNGMEIVLDRIQHGLIGSLRIGDEKLNKPFFRKNDIVHLRIPARLQKKDFILYMDHEEYFLRRIIKFVDEDIYVAGDNEREYHIAHKESVVAKAIARQRKKKWLSLTGFVNKKKFYVFSKVNLAKLRLGNRVKSYDEDVNSEAFELAMQNIDNQAQQQPKQQFVINIDLDSDLASFLNPDDLAKEWLASEEPEPEEVREIYVDEYGNPITEEEYNAEMYVDDEGNPLSEEEIEKIKAEEAKIEEENIEDAKKAQEESNTEDELDEASVEGEDAEAESTDTKVEETQDTTSSDSILDNLDDVGLPDDEEEPEPQIKKKKKK